MSLVIKTINFLANWPTTRDSLSSFEVTVLAPELWLVYVNYAKATNENGTTEEGARAIKAAFEYCVDHVGEDVESGKIWEEYVDFVKGVSPGFIAVRSLNFENFVLVGENAGATERPNFVARDEL